MHKSLINDVQIHYRIMVDSPLMIKSGEQNVLDPSLPDVQLIRQMKDGRLQEVIPGSSLKGVFRSRAEQLLRSQGYEIDNPFDKKSKSNQANGNGEQRYRQSCPISRLFGSLALRSRVRFTDAYPVNPDEIVTGIRNGVGINRITGGAQGKALYNLEVIEAGTFESAIYLENFELWQLTLILMLLKEMDEGYIRLGSAVSRGFGKVKVQIYKIRVRSFRPVENVAPISGYWSEDQTERMVQWQKDLFGWYYESDSLEEWIGEEGLLKNVQWPPNQHKEVSR